VTSRRLLIAGLAAVALTSCAAAPHPVVHSGVHAAAAATGRALPLPAAPTSSGTTAAVPRVAPGTEPTAGLDLRVVDGGVAAAGPPAEAEMGEVLGAVHGADRSRLAGYSVRLDIIPTGGSLTDLPAFGFLNGRTTFDGRPYSSLRAVGPTVAATTVTYAVGAEQVVPGLQSAYGPGFAVAHESGHVVRHLALSSGEDATLRRLYAGRRALGGPWLTDYAGSNDDEYFADATAAYFGHPWSDDTAGRFSRTWLAANDPGLLDLLRQVYGG
jgi:hypothetical protein